MASEPEVIRDKTAMRRWSRSHRSKGKTLAFVPTMGFLHEGHLALVRAAGDLADLTVVSIYVNPGQFAPSEDLDAYPADLRGDLYKLADLGVHAVFCPTNLYDYGEGGGRGDVQARRTEGAIGSSGSPVSCLEAAAGDGSGHETWVRVEKLERGLCGMSRPVFFRGVATIVAKLFNIVEPDIAVFGKKDYQQWRIICRMALSIYNSLSKAKYAALHEQSTCQELRSLVIQLVTEAGGRIDYVEIVEQESLIPVEEIDSPAVICIAAWFGAVRLIDNMEINP
ncbi:pantoate--beta-alanine ligase isoform X2 [Musa acuminata AAA Group]|uniref:pantoate--beta-alanine ligase isoform X2 n=1 Tax=Musa acuminata AAA Group TaxID=214697 RepID=UPI0031D24FA4